MRAEVLSVTAMFDTLKFARALRDGGSFTPEQAERLSDALSEAISGEVAARAGLEVTESKLGRKIDDLRAELKQDIVDLRAELKQDIAGLRADVGRMEIKIEAAKADTIKWVVGIISFQTVAIVGAAVVLARLFGR